MNIHDDITAFSRRSHISTLLSPKKVHPEENEEKPKAALLPYLRATTKHINKVLDRHEIPTNFQSPKIKQMSPSAKVPRSPLRIPGLCHVSYSCKKLYIGGVGRKISKRTKEHQRCSNYCTVELIVLIEHSMDTGHTIQSDQARTLAICQ